MNLEKESHSSHTYLRNTRHRCPPLVKYFQALIAQETEEIKQVFSAIKMAVQTAEDEALRPLEDRRKQVEQEIEELKRELQRNIATLSNDISDLQTVRDEEDPIFFLQVSNQSPVVFSLYYKPLSLNADTVDSDYKSTVTEIP